MFNCCSSLPLEQGLQLQFYIKVLTLSCSSLPLEQGLQPKQIGYGSEYSCSSLPLEQGLQQSLQRIRYGTCCSSLPLEQGLQQDIQPYSAYIFYVDKTICLTQANKMFESLKQSVCTLQTDFWMDRHGSISRLAKSRRVYEIILRDIMKKFNGILLLKQVFAKNTCQLSTFRLLLWHC